MELPALECYGAPLKSLIEAGEVDIALVDRSVRRVLALKESLGLFEHPYVDEAAVDAAYGQPDHVALAREAAQKSIVLLQNDWPAMKTLLPLAPERAARGDRARGRRRAPACRATTRTPRTSRCCTRTSGDAGILPQAGGAFAPGPYFPESVTPLAGIRARFDARRRTRRAASSPVTNRPDLAQVIAAGARRRRRRVLRRRASPACSRARRAASSATRRPRSHRSCSGYSSKQSIAIGTPVVVVVLSGRVHALPWLAEHGPAAVVYAWCPGEQGGAGLADVLCGDVDADRPPADHASRATWGRSRCTTTIAPAAAAARCSATTSTLPPRRSTPFGHGLSYTTFVYDRLARSSAATTDRAVHGPGRRHATPATAPGTEVVQCYLRDEVARVARPRKQLAGFARRRPRTGRGDDRRIHDRPDPARVLRRGHAPRDRTRATSA